jgi:hypothetical protein
VPARRYGDFDKLLSLFHECTCVEATKEVFQEFEWKDYRLVVAHRPDMASNLRDTRIEKIKALEHDAEKWASKLDHQDTGQTCRGRKLSDADVTACLLRRQVMPL